MEAKSWFEYQIEMYLAQNAQDTTSLIKSHTLPILAIVSEQDNLGITPLEKRIITKSWGGIELEF